MVLSGTYRAQVDRVREDVAILVLYRDDELVEEIAVDEGSLSERGIPVNGEFTVTLAGGAIRSLSRDPPSE